MNGKDLGSEGIGVCTVAAGIYIIGKLLQNVKSGWKVEFCNIFNFLFSFLYVRLC
jgi:hypothetical protein